MAKASNPSIVARRLLSAVNKITDPDRGTVDLERLLTSSMKDDFLGTMRLIKDVIPKEVFTKLAGIDGDKEENERKMMRRLERVLKEWQRLQGDPLDRALPVTTLNQPAVLTDVKSEVTAALGFDPGEHVVVPAARTTQPRRRSHVRGNEGGRDEPGRDGSDGADGRTELRRKRDRSGQRRGVTGRGRGRGTGPDGEPR